MRETMRLGRLAISALALLHLTVLGLSPLAAARHEAESAQVSHVESESNGPCTPDHDHRYCQLCRGLAPNAMVAESPRVHGSPGFTCWSPYKLVEPSLPSRTIASSLGSRAPPLS
jgi:hypothetical protein